jgi:hypothetical protein
LKKNTRSFKCRELEKLQMAREIFLSLNDSLIHFVTANDMARNTKWKQEITCNDPLKDHLGDLGVMLE